MYLKKTFIFMIAISLACTACKKKQVETEKPVQNVIEKPQLTVENGRFTPEIMWGLGKMGGSAVSPDGKQIAYTVTYYSMEQNKGNAELYVMNIDGSDVRRLTTTPENESCPQWADAENIAFMRGQKIMNINLSTMAESCLGEFEQAIEEFRFSPDGTRLLYSATLPVKRLQSVEKLYEGLDKTTGRINEDLMYRHWDGWVDEYPHIFLASLDSSRKIDTQNPVDILEGEPYECPMRPWGGLEQVSWSPDGSQIAYTCRKKTGKEYALSTNSDIYLYDIASKQTTNLSEGMMGYDQNPVFSHDGKSIAWESMEHDGYESDKTRLIVYRFDTKEHKDYTENFDYGVSSIAFRADDAEIFAVVMYRGTQEVFAFSLNDGAIRQVTKGIHDINGIEISGDQIIAQEVSMSHPAELFAYPLNGTESEGKQLTAINTEVLDLCRMGKTEPRWIKTTDNKDMLVWVIYPYDYDSSKTYPALLFCEGGPQSMVSQFWSTRWNFQVMSGAGYFIIAPNRRGCPGFGTAWCEEISGDYGGLCMKDYMQATDVIAKEMPQIDANRIGACGASFGAYSIYWLAGHNYGAKDYNEGRRFKAFLAHNGMFNFEQQCLETEEYWFTNWDLGGPYWEKNAKTAHSYANSPHRFVEKWNTPICVIHSEFDYRIVASQGMAAYNAAKLRGLEARYLYFPDESHWVLKPQNSLLWHRNFIDWFDKYLK